MSVGLPERLVSGAIGAGVLTAINQAAQSMRRDAPRMDLVGMQATARGIALAGGRVPDAQRLFCLTLVGDLVSNGIYYAAIPSRTSRATWTRAVAVGLSAGAGALLLSRYVIGNDSPHSDSPANNVMTVAWYLAGALAAAAAAHVMNKRRTPHSHNTA